jgi:pimeloyl-ACP methyl ester carboxylesterase
VPPATAALTIARLADDLAAVCRAADLPPATLIGHSLGVQVALETWRRHPDRVRALVLICGVPGRLIKSIDNRSLFSYLIPALSLLESLSPRAAWRLLRKLPSQVLARVAMWSQEINIRLIRRPDLDAYFNGLKSADLQVVLRLARAAGEHDATPYLSRIDVPVLILGGQLDRLAPPKILERMARTIPDSELLITPRGSHALPVEQPDLVNLRLRRFLEERL